MVNIEIWDVASGNRLFECGSQEEALQRVLELLPSQGGIDGLIVTGSNPADRLEGQELLDAVRDVLWGRVEQQATGERGGLNFTVSAPTAEIVSAV